MTSLPWLVFVMTSTGVQGWTFFDVRGGVPACQDDRGARTLRLNEDGVIDAVPRDGTWAAETEEGFQFFAIADRWSGSRLNNCPADRAVAYR